MDNTTELSPLDRDNLVEFFVTKTIPEQFAMLKMQMFYAPQCFRAEKCSRYLGTYLACEI